MAGLIADIVRASEKGEGEGLTMTGRALPARADDQMPPSDASDGLTSSLSPV